MVNNLLFWPTETADNKLMTHKSTVTSHIWLLERRLLTSTDMFRTLQGENATVTEVVYLHWGIPDALHLPSIGILIVLSTELGKNVLDPL